MSSLIIQAKIKEKIITFREQQVMLDKDLAELYGVEVKALNQAVKRNIERFPVDFMFQLTMDEAKNFSRSQFVTLKRGSNIKYPPYAFTEQGVAMLSSVLRSKKAAEINVAIMRVFVQIRRIAHTYIGLLEKINSLEKKQTKQDKSLENIFNTLNYLIGLNAEEDKNKKEIGFKTN